MNKKRISKIGPFIDLIGWLSRLSELNSISKAFTSIPQSRFLPLHFQFTLPHSVSPPFPPHTRVLTLSQHSPFTSLYVRLPQPTQEGTGRLDGRGSIDSIGFSLLMRIPGDEFQLTLLAYQYEYAFLQAAYKPYTPRIRAFPFRPPLV